MDTLYRAFTPHDIEVRSGGDGRIIHGIAVPWNKPYRIDARLVEQFAPGSANHQLRAANRIRFAREHLSQGGSLLGPTQLLRNDGAGLYFEARASKTPLGDETLELVRDGALRQLSVGFRERRNRNLPGGIIERVKADFTEIAVVLDGAYADDAVVTGVRSAVPAIGGEWGPEVDELGAGVVVEQERALALSAVDEVRAFLAKLPPLPPAI